MGSTVVIGNKSKTPSLINEEKKKYFFNEIRNRNIFIALLISVSCGALIELKILPEIKKSFVDGDKTLSTKNFFIIQIIFRTFWLYLILINNN